MSAKKISVAIIDGLVLWVVFLLLNIVLKYTLFASGSTSGVVVGVKEYFWPLFWLIFVLYLIFLHKKFSIGRKIVK